MLVLFYLLMQILLLLLHRFGIKANPDLVFQQNPKQPLQSEHPHPISQPTILYSTTMKYSPNDMLTGIHCYLPATCEAHYPKSYWNLDPPATNNKPTHQSQPMNPKPRTTCQPPWVHPVDIHTDLATKLQSMVFVLFGIQWVIPKSVIALLTSSQGRFGWYQNIIIWKPYLIVWCGVFGRNKMLEVLIWSCYFSNICLIRC